MVIASDFEEALLEVYCSPLYSEHCNAYLHRACATVFFEDMAVNNGEDFFACDDAEVLHCTFSMLITLMGLSVCSLPIMF